MTKHSSLAFLLILSLFAASFGQTPARPAQEQQSEQDEVVRISTNLVQIDAVVTDKSGRQVTDLRAEDFEIREDGRQQEITNLSYVSAPVAPVAAAPPASPTTVDKNAPPVPPTAPLKPEQVRRTMALVVDDLGLSFESVYHVRRALRKYVDEQMQPGDMVAIIRTSGGIGVLQQFTSDRRQLYAAIERIRWNMMGRGGVGAFAPIESDTTIARETGDEEQEDEEDGRNSSDDLNEFRSEIFAVGTLGAVNYIVRGLRDLPGRKSVLLISDGFRLFNRNNDSRRVLEALQRLTDLANRASVVIYTMDARGLQAPGLTAADDVGGLSAAQVEERLSSRRDELFDTQTGLIYLARQTGGFNIRNNNDLAGGIRRVTEDQSGYYLIGYRPEESTFDARTGERRFHKISVRVKREGLEVRSRAGFYGITDERAVGGRRTREEQLVGALISPFISGAIDLRLTSLFGNDSRAGGSFVRSLLYIDARDLTFKEEADGWHKAVMDVLALTFGDNGQVLDQVNRTQTIRIRGATFQNVLRNGLVFFLNVPVKKAGAYQLRVAVRDAANEQIGSASQFIEVPDLKKNQLALSGLIISGYEPKAGQSATNDASASAGAGQAIAGAEGMQAEALDPQAGAAVRRFRHGMIMNYGYMIYNAQLDKATRRPQLATQLRLYRDGRLIFTGKVQPVDTSAMTDAARLAAGGAIRLGSDMTPDEYVIQVTVTDLLVKDSKRRTTTQWIDFEIVK